MAVPDRDQISDSTRIPRLLEFALFLTALAWVGAASSVAGRAAQGLATRFNIPAFDALLEALFLLFLTVVGFRLLDLIATGGRQSSDILPLPARVTRAAEWGTGAAIGWALALATVLPLLLSVHMHTHFAWPAGTLLGITLAVGTLALAALAEEVVFRGYPFQRLSAALGQGTAALVMSIGFATTLLSMAFARPEHAGMALLDGTCFGLLLALCYMRTHALWLGWGLHFAYRAAMAVLLGLPIAGRASFASAAQTSTGGPTWLTGGSYGLDGALLTAVFLVAAIPVIYQVTHHWAWSYTHREITGAGYAVEVAPPAAHTAMERSTAAAPPPLVQILPTTPQTFSRQDPT